MADRTEQTLMDWGAAAEDDNDLRTEEGLRAYAERYSKREGVSLAEAMEHVSAQMERRRKVSAGIITTKPFR